MSPELIKQFVQHCKAAPDGAQDTDEDDLLFETWYTRFDELLNQVIKCKIDLRPDTTFANHSSLNN